MNDIEKNILSTLNSDPSFFNNCQKRNISKKMFLYPECKWLYDIITYHNESYGQVLKSDSLQTLLQQSTKIPEQSKQSISVLFEELKQLQPASNFDLLLDGFFEYYKFNSVKQVFSKAVESLSEGKVGNTICQTQSELGKLERELSPVTNASGFFKEDIVNITSEIADRLQNPDKYKGVLIGIPTIDRATGGLQKGSVSLIIGSQKSGKSVLMTNIVHNLIKNKKKVYYHVNEGGKKLVYNRYISRSTGIPVSKIRDVESMTPDEYNLCMSFLNQEDRKRHV